MHKSSWAKRIVAIILLIVTVAVPFTTMAGKWGNVHNWCSGGAQDLWLMLHPNEDWHRDYKYDYYDYKKISATRHSYTIECSGVCIFCGARVTLWEAPTEEDHTWVNSGTSDRTLITKNATNHVYGYYQHQKCSKNCGATKKYYTTQTSNHSWVYTYTDSNGKKHYKCSCGQTK